MKKLVSLMLAVAMLLTLCSFASADEPIVVKFWHNRASGANYDALVRSVTMFNEGPGAEKGIVVEETYGGGYDDLYAKVQLATQTDDVPTVAVSGNTYVVTMIDDGLLADMMPFAVESGFDTTNLIDCFMQIAGNTDGTLYSLPYVRSTPCFYYNKTMADELGIEIPQELTIEKMVEACKAAYKVDPATGEVLTYGFEMYNDSGYYNAAWLWQLGESLISVEGDVENRYSPALEGTSMLKTQTAWYNWVQEGWCRPFDSTNAGSIVKEMMCKGQVFAITDSSGSMKNLLRTMGEAGYELGVAQYPTYSLENKAVEAGGGQIVLIGKGNDEKTIKAGWEFLQFLMSDEQVFLNTTGTGYLPVTKSVAEFEDMKAFWEANPTYKVPFDQLVDHAVCQETPSFLYLQEVIQNWWEVNSLLIQEGSITPEQSVEMLKANTAHLWSK